MRREAVSSIRGELLWLIVRALYGSASRFGVSSRAVENSSFGTVCHDPSHVQKYAPSAKLRHHHMQWSFERVQRHASGSTALALQYASFRWKDAGLW